MCKRQPRGQTKEKEIDTQLQPAFKHSLSMRERETMERMKEAVWTGKFTSGGSFLKADGMVQLDKCKKTPKERMSQKGNGTQKGGPLLNSKHVGISTNQPDKHHKKKQRGRQGQTKI